MASTKVTLDLSGPFFKVDPKKAFRANARSMFEGLAQEGEQEVRALWPVLTGAGRDGTIGRTSSMTGRQWTLSMVVSEQHAYPWPNAGSKEYRGGKVEARVHMFRRVTAGIRRAKAILTADLTKGMN